MRLVNHRFLQVVGALVVVNAGWITEAQIHRAPNGHFYEVVSAPGVNWNDANAAAANRVLCGKRGHLATSTSQAENDFLNSIRVAFVVENGGEFNFWIGGFQSDKSDEPAGNWMWVNGEGPIPSDNNGPGYANWGPGEPNDALGMEEHLHIGFLDEHWWNDQDIDLSVIAGYIIEYDSDATVIIDGCDTGVPNAVVNDSYCTISDLIAECASGATNHAKFVSCVTGITNSLKRKNVITGKQQGKIVSCAVKADIP